MCSPRRLRTSNPLWLEFWGRPVGLPFIFHKEEKSNSGSRDEDLVRLGFSGDPKFKGIGREHLEETSTQFYYWKKM